MPESKPRNPWPAVALFAVAAITFAYAMGGVDTPSGPPPAVAKAIDDYNMVKALNDRSRMCLHASVVVSTMIAARDTAGAQTWRETERQDCGR